MVNFIFNKLIIVFLYKQCTLYIEIRVKVHDVVKLHEITLIFPHRYSFKLSIVEKDIDDFLNIKMKPF